MEGRGGALLRYVPELQGVTAHRNGKYRAGRNPAERKNKMKFKVGDRVRFIGGSLTIPSGEMGVVKGFLPRGTSSVALEVDHEITWHNCNGLTRPRRGWWVSESDIELKKPAEREFKLIIVSKGDVTTAKLLHGKTVEQEATVKRYHEDEYSGKAAIDAVVKKLFGEDEKKKEKPKYFTGRAVWIGSDTPWRTNGKIYVFNDGKYIDNKGTEHGSSWSREEVKVNSAFLPIVE